MACEILPTCVKEWLVLLNANPTLKSSFLVYAQSQLLAIDAQLLVLQASVTRMTALVQTLETTVLTIETALNAAFSRLKILDILGLSKYSFQCPHLKKIVEWAENATDALLSVFPFKQLQNFTGLSSLLGQKQFELARALQRVEDLQNKIISLTNLRFLLQGMIDCLNELVA